MRCFTWLIAAALTGAAGGACFAAEPAGPKRLWVYAPVNFQVNEATDRLIALMRRSKEAGYNGLVITDHKFGRIQGRPEWYYTNLHKARDAAKGLELTIAAAVMPVGYSNSILMNNPHLAEGIAVRDCALVVRGTTATVADASNLLPGGDFERMRDDRATGWDFVDGPGQSTFRDDTTFHGGAASLRMTDFRKGNEHGNCRVSKQIAVKPWHQYRARVWIRTQDVSPAGDVRIAVLTGSGRSLNHTNLGVKPTQPWTPHEVLFNSMEHESVRFYAGIWGGEGGSIWIDDLSVTQAAGVNLLRREGCPVRVTSEDGGTTYEEGRDFLRWFNPKVGHEPYEGEFVASHPDTPLTLTDGSRIKDGQRIKVSFYHTATIYDGQVACCLRHDEVFEHFDRQVRELIEHLRPAMWFMQHDELRVAGQCGLCRREGESAGQVLAENARRCTAVIRRHAGDAPILVWSDMFDPHHNAVDHYYLVGSTLAGSWQGLDKSVTIMNWNGGKPGESLRFFAERGHGQIIAGYYDSDAVEREVDRWLSAASGVKGAEGIMYTTWRNDYRHLERFADAVRERWATLPR